MFLKGGRIKIDDNFINTASNNVFPFVFSFACKTGNFGHSSSPNMGEFWIRSKKGSITYFGSSVTSMTNSDNAIEEKIFGDAFKDEMNIGITIALGMKRYCNRFWSATNRNRTIRYMKSYNLLGDPSLNYKGCVENIVFANNEIFNNGLIITYKAITNIENTTPIQILSGSNVTFSAGNSINLNPGFSIEQGAVFEAKIKPCNE